MNYSILTLNEKLSPQLRVLLQTSDRLGNVLADLENQHRLRTIDQILSNYQYVEEILESSEIDKQSVKVYWTFLTGYADVFGKNRIPICEISFIFAGRRYKSFISLNLNNSVKKIGDCISHIDMLPLEIRMQDLRTVVDRSGKAYSPSQDEKLFFTFFIKSLIQNQKVLLHQIIEVFNTFQGELSLSCGESGIDELLSKERKLPHTDFYDELLYSAITQLGPYQKMEQEEKKMLYQVPKEVIACINPVVWSFGSGTLEKDLSLLKKRHGVDIFSQEEKQDLPYESLLGRSYQSISNQLRYICLETNSDYEMHTKKLQQFFCENFLYSKENVFFHQKDILTRLRELAVISKTERYASLSILCNKSVHDKEPHTIFMLGSFLANFSLEEQKELVNLIYMVFPEGTSIVTTFPKSPTSEKGGEEQIALYDTYFERRALHRQLEASGISPKDLDIQFCFEHEQGIPKIVARAEHDLPIFLNNGTVLTPGVIQLYESWRFTESYIQKLFNNKNVIHFGQDNQFVHGVCIAGNAYEYAYKEFEDTGLYFLHMHLCSIVERMISDIKYDSHSDRFGEINMVEEGGRTYYDIYYVAENDRREKFIDVTGRVYHDRNSKKLIIESYSLANCGISENDVRHIIFKRIDSHPVCSLLTGTAKEQKESIYMLSDELTAILEHFFFYFLQKHGSVDLVQQQQY